MERVKIKADVMWAYTDRQNDLSNKYQIDLCNLSDPAVNALESMGISVNQKEGKGYFITCKSSNPIKAYDSDGQQLTGFPPMEDGQPSPQSIQIGNDSKAIALVSFYEWSWKNKTGVSPSLKKLVITDLVKYDDDVGEVLVSDDDEDEIL